jgi:hypothetical protein
VLASGAPRRLDPALGDAGHHVPVGRSASRRPSDNEVWCCAPFVGYSSAACVPIDPLAQLFNGLQFRSRDTHGTTLRGAGAGKHNAERASLRSERLFPIGTGAHSGEIISPVVDVNRAAAIKPISCPTMRTDVQPRLWARAWMSRPWRLCCSRCPERPVPQSRAGWVRSRYD